MTTAEDEVARAERALEVARAVVREFPDAKRGDGYWYSPSVVDHPDAQARLYGSGGSGDSYLVLVATVTTRCPSGDGDEAEVYQNCGYSEKLEVRSYELLRQLRQSDPILWRTVSRAVAELAREQVQLEKARRP